MTVQDVKHESLKWTPVWLVHDKASVGKLTPPIFPENSSQLIRSGKEKAARPKASDNTRGLVHSATPPFLHSALHLASLISVPVLLQSPAWSVLHAGSRLVAVAVKPLPLLIIPPECLDIGRHIPVPPRLLDLPYTCTQTGVLTPVCHPVCAKIPIHTSLRSTDSRECSSSRRARSEIRVDRVPLFPLALPGTLEESDYTLPPKETWLGWLIRRILKLLHVQIRRKRLSTRVAYHLPPACRLLTQYKPTLVQRNRVYNTQIGSATAAPLDALVHRHLRERFLLDTHSDTTRRIPVHPIPPRPCDRAECGRSRAFDRHYFLHF